MVVFEGANILLNVCMFNFVTKKREFPLYCVGIRNPNYKNNTKKLMQFEVVGGKYETSDETIERCAQREFQEETGTLIDLDRIRDSKYYDVINNSGKEYISENGEKSTEPRTIRMFVVIIHLREFVEMREDLELIQANSEITSLPLLSLTLLSKTDLRECVFANSLDVDYYAGERIVTSYRKRTIKDVLLGLDLPIRDCNFWILRALYA